MAASEHLSPAQFHYHQSPMENRAGIDKHGLLLSEDDGEGETPPGVYMSPKPGGRTHDHDVWKVNTTGLHLEEDSPGNMAEFATEGGSYYAPHDIPRDRLTLHIPAGETAEERAWRKAH
jgi:hypothetical protein